MSSSNAIKPMLMDAPVFRPVSLSYRLAAVSATPPGGFCAALHRAEEPPAASGSGRQVSS
jgi:hypothetical protein